jgi:hypothetical protein
MKGMLPTFVLLAMTACTSTPRDLHCDARLVRINTWPLPAAPASAPLKDVSSVNPHGEITEGVSR